MHANVLAAIGPLETGFYTHTKPLMGCVSLFCFCTVTLLAVVVLLVHSVLITVALHGQSSKVGVAGSMISDCCMHSHHFFALYQ